jgi:hypothetical protein
MNNVTLYEYDHQLRPGTIGADFETGDPNTSFVRRYEVEDAENLMRDIAAWILEGVSNPTMTLGRDPGYDIKMFIAEAIGSDRVDFSKSALDTVRTLCEEVKRLRPPNYAALPYESAL